MNTRSAHRLTRCHVCMCRTNDPEAVAVAETVQHFITAMDSLKLNLCAVDQVEQAAAVGVHFPQSLQDVVLLLNTGNKFNPPAQ